MWSLLGEDDESSELTLTSGSLLYSLHGRHSTFKLLGKLFILMLKEPLNLFTLQLTI